uniref:Uncharacterized protein n=1 Tax=Tetradesmus obliquus TaxID=3088 RepID=A0A383WIQ5_TETOB|eukprot:jgi/Sobl393_1/4993/SZX76626.1
MTGSNRTANSPVNMVKRKAAPRKTQPGSSTRQRQASELHQVDLSSIATLNSHGRGRGRESRSCEMPRHTGDDKAQPDVQNAAFLVQDVTNDVDVPLLGRQPEELSPAAPPAAAVMAPPPPPPPPAAAAAAAGGGGGEGGGASGGDAGGGVGSGASGADSSRDGAIQQPAGYAAVVQPEAGAAAALQALVGRRAVRASKAAQATLRQ